MRAWAVAAAVLAGVATVQPQAPAHNAVLTGTVVRADTNAPIGGARVVAARVGGPLEEYRTATTDNAGRFAMRDLGAGSYRVFADHDNYLQGEYGRRLAGATGTSIALIDGQTAPPIVVPMTAPGAIAGRVLDRGRPARRIWLRALKASYIDGRRSMRVITWAQSDDRGEFRLFGLQPGLYYVSATPFARPRIVGETLQTPLIPSTANGNTYAATVPLTADSLDPAALDPFVYPPVFHPGTIDLSIAVPVDVRAGETAAGLSLALARVMPFKVRGRITGASVEAQAASPVRISVTPLADAGTGASVAGTDSRDGTFELRGVPPGRYYLAAQIQSTTAAPTRYGTFNVIEVIDRDLDGVVLALKPGVTVTGTVSIDGRPPAAADGAVSVQLLAGPGLPGGAGAVRVQPDGTFSVANIIPGDFRFRVIQAGHTPWVKAARFGADDVTLAPIRIDGAPAGRALEITIGARPATLAATVVDRTGRPQSGVLVVVVPDATRRDRSTLFRSVTTDAQGRIHLDEVAPGEYKVFATADIEAAAWQDPDVLKRMEASGQLIRLAEGGTANVQLRLQ